jgi:hypothetical protein
MVDFGSKIVIREAEAQHQSQASPLGLVVEEMKTGQESLRVLRVSPISMIPSMLQPHILYTTATI